MQFTVNSYMCTLLQLYVINIFLLNKIEGEVQPSNIFFEFGVINPNITSKFSITARLNVQFL